MKGIIEYPYVPIPKENILRRLGYSKNVQINPKKLTEIELVMYDAYSLCSPVVMYDIFPLETIEPDQIIIDGEEFISTNLYKYLKNYNKVIMIIATVGDEIVDKIKEKMSVSPEEGVIYDAVGSEVVDSALDVMQEQLTRMLKRESKEVAKARFSFGYGDTKLEYQKWYFEHLNPQKIGITLSDSYIMHPEKSVSALIGVKEY